MRDRLIFVNIKFMLILALFLSAAHQEQNEFCPVMTDEKTDSSSFVEYEGRKIFFCCKKCPKTFMKNPQRYLQNIQKGKVEQTEAGEEGPNKFIKFTGKFHPMLIHFPIVLILVCAFYELVNLKLKKDINIRALLLIGMIFSILSMITGLSNSVTTELPEELEIYEEFHKYIGISIAILSTATFFLHAKGSASKIKKFYLAALFVCAILVIIGGHLGAALVYGPDYFFECKAILAHVATCA